MSGKYARRRIARRTRELSNYNVRELRAMADGYGLPFTTRTRKAELCAIIAREV